MEEQNFSSPLWNLKAEMTRRDVRARDIALCIQRGTTATSNKINGHYPFLTDESLKIHKTFFQDLDFAYLFRRES